MAAVYHLGMVWKKGIFFPADLEKAIAYLEEASKGKNQYAVSRQYINRVRKHFYKYFGEIYLKQ